MVDLAPEGSIPLSEFFDRYSAWKWNGASPFQELDIDRRIVELPGERVLAHRASIGRVSDAVLAEVAGLFSWGKVSAFVLMPGDPVKRVLSSRSWSDAFFPERMFLTDHIERGHGPEFDMAVGRTPFVRSVDVEDALRDLKDSDYGSASRSALRDCLIGLVMDGVMIDGHAEGFAKRWGLGPLESQPPEGKFDPRKQSVWTLPMAVTWIAWRDYRRVREAMDDYRSECWEWFGISRRLPLANGIDWYEVDGQELRTLEPLSLFTMGLMEALDTQSRPEELVMSVKSARESLWAKLTENSLVATGINSAGDVVQIPAREWAYIVLTADARMTDRLVFRTSNKPAYGDVTLLRSDLIAAWPPDEEEVTAENFNISAPIWTLLEAATWVGCRGKQLTSNEIADQNLEEEGAVELFASLSQAQGLVATGINRKRVREQIPPEYWELATIDPELFRQRHYVSFIDDELEEYGGQFTPYGEDEPRWFGIRVQRDALFAAFPGLAPVGHVRRGSVGSKRSRKREATRVAIAAVFPAGVPAGLGDKERLARVNDWLISNGHSTVSLPTLNRATRAS